MVFNKKNYLHEYYLKNKDKHILVCRKYALLHKEKTKKFAKKYYSKNKKHLLVYAKKYYILNKSKKNAYAKNYNKLNVNKLRKQHKKRFILNKKKLYRKIKKRHYLDIFFRLNKNLISSLNQSLKHKLNDDCPRKWEKLLGYSKKDLIKQLFINEKIKKDYLNGKLEIDHKTPLSWFNIFPPTNETLRKAWALENLHLISKSENRIKNNHYCSNLLLALSLI